MGCCVWLAIRVSESRAVGDVCGCTTLKRAFVPSNQVQVVLDCSPGWATVTEDGLLGGAGTSCARCQGCMGQGLGAKGSCWGQGQSGCHSELPNCGESRLLVVCAIAGAVQGIHTRGSLSGPTAWRLQASAFTAMAQL
jgi:hypothetical protein